MRTSWKNWMKIRACRVNRTFSIAHERRSGQSLLVAQQSICLRAPVRLFVRPLGLFGLRPAISLRRDRCPELRPSRCQRSSWRAGSDRAGVWGALPCPEYAIGGRGGQGRLRRADFKLRHYRVARSLEKHQPICNNGALGAGL